MLASNGFHYLRRGAQNLAQKEHEQIRQLQYLKGVISFETELLNASKDIITQSQTAFDFIRQVVPQQTPEKWFRKQLLIDGERPTVAGALLFAEEPQAALPKRSGIKIYRYKTTEPAGFRDALAFDPITIEGWLYSQIYSSVRKTTEIIESIPKLGHASLIAVRYPTEALHEIITNALLHRDYSIADDVHIRIFDNRVEVESPGRLPAQITVENTLGRAVQARNGRDRQDFD